MLRKAGVDNMTKYKSLFFNKDVRAAVLMKSLTYNSYTYLVHWANENFSGMKELSHDKQMKNAANSLQKNRT